MILPRSKTRSLEARRTANLRRKTTAILPRQPSVATPNLGKQLHNFRGIYGLFPSIESSTAEHFYKHLGFIWKRVDDAVLISVFAYVQEK